MIAVVQRVTGAAVVVEGKEVSRIGRGLLVFVGVAEGDEGADVEYTARKVARMRVFSDGEGKMNRALRDVDGELLIVSQFTLLGDCRRGNRPGFSAAASPAEGERLYGDFVSKVTGMTEKEVKTGIFGADMKVSIENDGPVTFILDSRE